MQHQPLFLHKLQRAQASYSRGFLSDFMNCFKKAETCDCFKKGRRMLMEGENFEMLKGGGQRERRRKDWVGENEVKGCLSL